MNLRFFKALKLGLVVSSLSAGWLQAQQPRVPAAKAPAPFQWVNSFRGPDIPGLQHATFKSPSLGVEVGYCIYLPPGYDKPSHASWRYPVVYYLHGGRPGSETKSVSLMTEIHPLIAKGQAGPMIYVFVNGGPVSHYNVPSRKVTGKDVFIQELIPHIDATYRTVARREGRGLEGFSQGGRGTTRIMFRHPDLFYSCAPGGSGYATEKRISEENGKESESLVFEAGDNTWDLARGYVNSGGPALRILIHVGTKGFNYENNLEYMKFLDSLMIPYERLVVPDVPHSAKMIYQKEAKRLVHFHSENFLSQGTLPK